MDENKALWKKCVEFHGHECGGLTIGYKASLYAIALLGLGLGGGGNAGCLSADGHPRMQHRQRKPAVPYARQTGLYVF